VAPGLFYWFIRTEISFQTTFSPFNFPEKGLVFMLWVKVLLFIKRLFTFFATPWSTNGRWAIRGQLSRALGPALPSTRIQSPLYFYMFSLVVSLGCNNDPLPATASQNRHSETDDFDHNTFHTFKHDM
jgi:hypothetical protein